MDSSELAARNLVEQEETSKSVEMEGMDPEWTDEKHGLFLKSMESTFVNQLYRSIEMFGLQSHKSSASRSKSLRQKQTSARTSGQFKVLRDGFWSKVDFQKDEHEHEHKHNQGNEYKVPLSNPWIQRYRNSKIQSTKRCPASCAKAPLAMPRTTNNSPSSSKDFSGSNIEVSDQNFNEEEKPAKIDQNFSEEEESAKVDDMNNSSNDQVVPKGNIIEADDFVKHYVHKPLKEILHREI